MARRVYASFRRRDGWHVEFFERDLRTPLRKSLRFSSEHKLIELAKRGRADLHVLENRTALQYGFEVGHGGFFLNLTDELYRRLL